MTRIYQDVPEILDWLTLRAPELAERLKGSMASKRHHGGIHDGGWLQVWVFPAKNGPMNTLSFFGFEKFDLFFICKDEADTSLFG